MSQDLLWATLLWLPTRGETAKVTTGNPAINGPTPKSWLVEHNNWVFLLPTVLFFVWYQVYPIVRVVWISFTDYKYLTNDPANWVGFDNYVEALSDPLMWDSLGRAAYFTAMFLPGTIIIFVLFER